MKKLLIFLMLMLCVCTMAYGQALDRTHVGYVNPLQYGASCNATTLNAAITAIGSAVRTLIITDTDRAKVACTWTLAANVTVPSNVTLYVPTGSQISHSGFTLTVNGPFVADGHVFTTTASVVFGPSSVTHINPLWWGTALTDTTLSAMHTATGSATLPVTLPVGTWTIAGNITLPRRLTYTIPQGAIFSINTTITVTVDGCIEAGTYRIISGAGVVRYTNKGSCAVVKLEWWGADPTGVGTDTETYVNLAVAALPSGGVVLGAGPQAHYKFTAGPANITKSYLTLDWQGALLTSTSSIAVATLGTEPALSGDYSTVVFNSHFKNARVGSANDGSNLLRLPQMIWCENCSVQDVYKKGLSTTTSMTLRVCQNCLLRNVYIEGGDGTGFGTLVHMSNNTTVDNWHLSDCNCVYGLQIKGGRDNVVVNSSIQNMTGGGVDEGFRDRGDAPWSASATTGVKYPWATLAANDCNAVNCWGIADSRRASYNSKFVNVSVINSPDIIAYRSTEAIGTLFNNVSAENVGLCFVLSRGTGGSERDYVVSNFYCSNVGTTNDLLNPAFSVEGVSGNHFPGVKIVNGVIENSNEQGIRFDYTDDIVIDNVTVRNPGITATNTYGIEARNANNRPRLMNSTVEDLQSPSTMTHGILFGSLTVRPTVANNIFRCTNCAVTWFPMNSWILGDYNNNFPGEGTAQTTDATVEDARLRMAFGTGDVAKICVDVVAKQSTTNRAYYKACGVFYDVAGTVTQQGANFETTTVESDAAWGGLSFSVATNSVRIRVQGVAATTIDWVLKVSTAVLD